jgi:SAM-dependent methyltransferase
LARELSSDLAMLEWLAKPAGKDVVDIGCGGGGLARALAAGGARVTGVEISEEQLAGARTRDDGSGIRYLVGTAQDLPIDDASIDVAIFMRSLHHVPVDHLPQALREARRVLRPGGLIYVAEPLTEGDYFALTRLVEDELAVRQAAQEALADAPRAGLEHVHTVEYDVRLCLANLAAFHSHTVSVDPSRAEVFDARQAELAELFDRLGEPGERPGERCFRQPTRADLLRAAAVVSK